MESRSERGEDPAVCGQHARWSVKITANQKWPSNSPFTTCDVFITCVTIVFFLSYRAERRERSKRGRFQDVARGPRAVRPAGQADRTQISESLTRPHTDTSTHAHTLRDSED